MQMNFMKGDILAADRGLYRHYGIYSGDGKVIHFVGFYHGKRNLLHVRVRETSLEEFVCGSAVFVDNSSSGDRRSREEIVREAKKYLDKKFGRGLQPNHEQLRAFRALVRERASCIKSGK